MLSKFRFWLAWMIMPHDDRFRYHYYLMFWQEACIWSPKQWRKVQQRALVRARMDFALKDGELSPDVPLIKPVSLGEPQNAISRAERTKVRH